MPNLSQPQGVSLTIDGTQSPEQGFIEIEKHEKQGRVTHITLPNIVYIKGNPSVPVVMNDGLLRTHQDEIIINCDTGAKLYILAKPIKTAADLEKAENIAAQFNLSGGQSRLRLLNGVYSLTVLTALENTKPSV